MQRKLQYFAKKFDNFRSCVKLLCELQVFAALDAYDIHHHPHLELWYRHGNLSAPLHRFTAFFQGEDKSIERGENHYKSGHVESFSYADGEIVGDSESSHRTGIERKNSRTYWNGYIQEQNTPASWSD